MNKRTKKKKKKKKNEKIAIRNLYTENEKGKAKALQQERQSL
jgi:hypothetical protein